MTFYRVTAGVTRSNVTVNSTDLLMVSSGGAELIESAGSASATLLSSDIEYVSAGGVAPPTVPS